MENSPALLGGNLISLCNCDLSRIDGLKFHLGKTGSCHHHLIKAVLF